MKTYWGDLHNHCAASYGQGLPSQALANARAHLDFCTLTGHAFWPDMPMDLETQNQVIAMHLGGFAKLQYYWADLLAALREANRPGSFVALPSYEWHSMRYGDYNCYAPAFDLELIDAPDVRQLAKSIAARRSEFFLLPHHCAYQCGYRGTNWNYFDERVSPLVEIFSNHGCGEADDAPHDYHHSMGPRNLECSVRHGLLQGHRFGFYASTDSHDGYPGHYGHGCVGVRAEKLGLLELWEAMRHRRTIATTGARIEATVDAGDGGIGDVLRQGPRDIILEVEGTSPLEAVELVEGADGLTRITKLPTPKLETRFDAGQHKLKIEVGWGRGSQTTQWQVEGRLIKGKLLGMTGCFRFSSVRTQTEATERIVRRGTHGFLWRAQSIPNAAGAYGGTHFNAGGTQAIVLDVIADKSTRLELKVSDMVHDLPLRTLVRGSFARHIGGFGSPALKVHRAIPEREFKCRVELRKHNLLRAAPAFAYFRVRQTDGQVAWISPLWFE